MLHKYASHFDELTSDQAILIATRLHLPLDEDRDITGPDLFEICEASDLDQADVVMSLADDFSVSGVRAIETLVGRPIQRTAPTPAPTPGRPTPSPREKTSKPRRGGGAPDMRVIATVRPNPKKVGSAPALRYEAYRVGMTVEQAISAGLTAADIAWDSDPKRSFITLLPPGSIVEGSDV